MSIENDILSAVRSIESMTRRLETKTTRGFSELGIDIGTDAGWIRVNDVLREVHVSTLGRSMSVLLSEMRRAGASQIGKEYTLLHNGRVIGQIICPSE